MKKEKVKIGITRGVIETHFERNEVKGIYNKDITISIANHGGGYHFIFENKKGETLSAIYHSGSYGCEKGLFEIMPPKAPKSWGDSVKGYLTFEEVIKWVKKTL